jgi:hypothetical protein
MKHSTLRSARGGINIPDELPSLMVRLQAKVDIANDFFHSQFERTIELGRRIEQEVREQVRELIGTPKPAEPATIEQAVNVAYGCSELAAQDADYNDMKRTQEDARL